MPRSRVRRKNRADGTARNPRAARAQARQAAELFGPLPPDQMIAAEGYLAEAIETKIAQFDAELADMRAKLAALPTPAPALTAAAVESATLRDEIDHLGDARIELEAMLDAVRNRRHFSVPGSLAVMVIRGASRKLVADAERLGVDVDAEALAEAKRREVMISRWLMNFEGAPEIPSPLAVARAARP